MSPRSRQEPLRLRCAVYTRKSSDEGLEQSFNSLHAQREACEAYIKSQAHEGWVLKPALYDDGGFSGGSMDRPALSKLLVDIQAGEIDVVVVYKVDRLTRALADFAKIVEIFDGAGVSFVSITQAFNTTTSMGRLTLNVLLSFAQFEREVTGERIRDKIAASKAKGMWMGGVLPLGYDSKDHRLIINETEATVVRHIFARYLKLGSVHRLRDELERQGIRSKAWVTSAGRAMGGQVFTRGALFHLLQNPHYVGLIRHRDVTHPGQHEPITSEAQFAAVQRKLEKNRVTRRSRPKRADTALLKGKLVDHRGRPYSPAFAYGKTGVRYGYYVLADVQQGLGTSEASDGLHRIPTQALEDWLLLSLARLTGHSAVDRSQAAAIIRRLEVRPNEARLTLDAALVFADDPAELGFQDLQRRLQSGERAVMTPERGGEITVAIPGRLQFRGGRTWCNEPHSRRKLDPVLIRGLKAAHRLALQNGFAPASPATAAQAPPDAYDRKLCRLVFLAPDIQEKILNGRQPADLTLAKLLDATIPLAWDDQRRVLGVGRL